MSQGGFVSQTGETEITSEAVIADNAVVRGDGGVRGVQGSGVLIDDSDNITAAGASLTTPLPIASGGTAAATATLAFDGLSPTTTKGDIIASDGTNNVRLVAGANDTVLTADSTAASGVKWAEASGGGATNLPGIGTRQGTVWSMTQLSNNHTNLAVTDSRLVLAPFWTTAEITLTNVAISCSGGVAGATTRLGIYSFEPVSGLFTLLGDYGTVDCSAFGFLSAAATDTMLAGTHYFSAIVTDENGGSVSIACGASPMAMGWDSASFSRVNAVYKDGVSAGSSLPATIPWADVTSNGTGLSSFMFYR